MNQLFVSSSVDHVGRASPATPLHSVQANPNRLRYLARNIAWTLALPSLTLLGGCAATPPATAESASLATRTAIYADEASDVNPGTITRRARVTPFAAQGEEARAAWVERSFCGFDQWGNPITRVTFHDATADTRSWRAIVPVWIDGESLPRQFLVDTGADRTVVSTRCYSTPVQCRPGGPVHGIGGFQFVGLRDFAVDACGFKFNSMECQVANMPDMDGVIGQDFLRHFKVTFDYPNLKLILEPSD